MEATTSDSERNPSPNATVGERAAAAAIAIVIVTAGVVAARFGGMYLGESAAVLPAIYGGSFVALLVSATIARNQFKANGVPMLAFLSNLFGISALLLVPFVLAMPHMFSNGGIGFGDQSVVWLWTLRHAMFALLVICCVVGEAYYRKRILSGQESHAIGLRYAVVCAFAALASIFAVLFFHAKLPSLGDANGFSALFHRYAEPGLLGLDALALAGIVFTTRLRQTASIWLAIIVLAFGVQTYAGAEGAHGQLTLGWYVLLGAGALVQAMYLLVQLRNANEQLVAYAADKKSLIETTLRDPLTGLLNRRGFDERIEEILAESRLDGKAASVVIFDIDHFKAFNDAFGHPAGDDALRKIADAIANVANRPTDAVCRVGGEEFAMVLGETDASGAMTVAERIRAAVMRLRIQQDPEFSKNLSVSVGTATAFPSVVLSSAELYVRADKALYKAKRLGRNRIATHDVTRDGDLQIV